jgi:putative endonuclease
LAERLVVEYLLESGCKIVATNLRIGALELDVVARQGPVIMVVEVRTRGLGAWTTALGSVGLQKRRRVRLAGERLWDRRYQKDPSVERMRFDVATVTFAESGGYEVEYIPAAF